MVIVSFGFVYLASVELDGLAEEVVRDGRGVVTLVEVINGAVKIQVLEREHVLEVVAVRENLFEVFKFNAPRRLIQQFLSGQRDLWGSSLITILSLCYQFASHRHLFDLNTLDVGYDLDVKWRVLFEVLTHFVTLKQEYLLIE